MVPVILIMLTTFVYYMQLKKQKKLPHASEIVLLVNALNRRI